MEKKYFKASPERPWEMPSNATREKRNIALQEKLAEIDLVCQIEDSRLEDLVKDIIEFVEKFPTIKQQWEKLETVPQAVVSVKGRKSRRDKKSATKTRLEYFCDQLNIKSPRVYKESPLFYLTVAKYNQLSSNNLSDAEKLAEEKQLLSVLEKLAPPFFTENDAQSTNFKLVINDNNQIVLMVKHSLSEEFVDVL